MIKPGVPPHCSELTAYEIVTALRTAGWAIVRDDVKMLPARLAGTHAWLESVLSSKYADRSSVLEQVQKSIGELIGLHAADRTDDDQADAARDAATPTTERA